MIRGNERKNIFLDEEDKMRFMEILFAKKQEKKFFLHAYCLMDNHVHLLLSEGSQDVATVMKRINVSYVSYFNKKYKRVGHLMQDRFRSEPVENDQYAIALARYIHQNPVKARVVQSVGEYKWSSYPAYLNQNKYPSTELETDIILGIFSPDKKIALKQFAEYMNEPGQEAFIDISPEVEVMDEKEARELFQSMLQERGIEPKSDLKTELPAEIIKVFKAKTNLSIRKIADIVGLNKDKVNKILLRA